MILIQIIMRHLGRFLTNSYKDGFETIPPPPNSLSAWHLRRAPCSNQDQAIEESEESAPEGVSFPLTNPSP